MKKRIVYEVHVNDQKQEQVRVFGVFSPRDFVKLALAEILIKLNENFFLAIDSTRKEIKKLGFQKIYEKEMKRRFEETKDDLEPVKQEEQK